MDEKQPVRHSRSAATRWILILLKFLLSQWQIIGICIAVILAWLFPNVGRRGGVIKSQYVLGIFGIDRQIYYFIWSHWDHFLGLRSKYTHKNSERQHHETSASLGRASNVVFGII
jgi:hypothetical protein